jgi:hypothetical protein
MLEALLTVTVGAAACTAPGARLTDITSQGSTAGKRIMVAVESER